MNGVDAVSLEELAMHDADDVFEHREGWVNHKQLAYPRIPSALVRDDGKRSRIHTHLPHRVFVR